MIKIKLSMAKDKNKFLPAVYLILFIALLYVLIELILNYYGKGICTQKSCEIASMLTTLSKKGLLFLALFYFLSLLSFIILYNLTQGNFFLNLTLFLLSAGLISEGILTLRLLFDYELLCYYCFGLSLIFLLLFLFYLFFIKEKNFTIWTIFFIFLGAFLGLFLSFKITAFSLSNMSKFKEDKILIYSTDCPRCKEILQEITFKVETLPYYRVYPLLKILGLKSLPLLIEKKEGATVIWQDPEKIEEILLGKSNRTEGNCNNNIIQGGLCVLP